MRFLLGLVLAVRWLSAQAGQEARKNDPPAPPQAPRTDGGLVNAAALRNENVQVNLIDNDGLKEASIRLGDKVTVIPEASRVCEDDLIGGKTGCILKAGLDMLRPELGICSEDELARLSGCELLQNSHRWTKNYLQPADFDSASPALFAEVLTQAAAAAADNVRDDFSRRSGDPLPTSVPSLLVRGKSRRAPAGPRRR